MINANELQERMNSALIDIAIQGNSIDYKLFALHIHPQDWQSVRLSDEACHLHSVSPDRFMGMFVTITSLLPVGEAELRFVVRV